MIDTVISARGLGKRYTMRGGRDAETLAGYVRSLFKRRREARPDGGRFDSDGFWALRDLSFDVRRGDVMGVVGRNGAGKSTLLKILANITAPTTGEVTVRGRVGSLLEVGTGFSPDLSGRENVHLSAAILGMHPSDIARRFDEIVAFADIPGFIDTPVKHYSSGMYMRLAFAVAAHLDHEILLVDEVLAVGDAAFQRKCLGKIGSEASSGRTILFVSHSLPAVAALCNRALLLDGGCLLRDDRADVVLREYQKSMSTGLSGLSALDLGAVEHYGNGKARFTWARLEVRNSDGSLRPVMATGCDLVVELTIEASVAIADVNVAVVIYDPSGYRVIDASLLLAGQSLSMAAGEVRTVRFVLRDVLLKPDEYSVGIWIGRTNAEDIDGVLHAVTLSVEPDLDTIRHSAAFPGVYQCRFDASTLAVQDHVDAV
jgi:lipopolysaccharide transport system ATP-binding protein